jgi:hypothetical protein
MLNYTKTEKEGIKQKKKKKKKVTYDNSAKARCNRLHYSVLHESAARSQAPYQVLARIDSYARRFATDDSLLALRSRRLPEQWGDPDHEQRCRANSEN